MPPPLNPIFIVFCQGSLRKITPSTLPLHDGQLLQEVLKVWPQLWQGPQIKISGGLPKYLFFRCCSWVQESYPSMGASWTQWRGPRLVVFLWWCPTSPVALPLWPSSWLVLAPGTVADVWLCPSGGLAESFYAFLQCSGSCQGLPVGFPGLSEFSLPWSVPPSSLGSSVTIARGTSAGDSGSPPPPDCSPPLCLRQSFKDTMSFILCSFWPTMWASGHILDGRGPQFLCWMSGNQPAGWQIRLPQSPALGGPAGDHSKLTSLLLSTQIQWHVWTSMGGWMGSVVLQHPIWGTHPEITLHLDNALPLQQTVLLPLPTP